jgi:hypothetical protein
MAWWMAIPAAMQVAGSIYQGINGLNQSKLMREYGAERVRRMRLQHDQVTGQAEAAAGASGIEYESASNQTRLAVMAQEFRNEEDWLRKSVRTEANATEMSSIFSLFSGIGQGLTSYGQATNWGRK